MGQDYPSFREHTRAAIRSRAELRFDERPDLVLGLAVNVSEGGMFVEVEQPRPVGTLLRFRLLLANAAEPTEPHEISGFGEVVWLRMGGDRFAPGCGVQFRFLDPGGRDRLRLVLKRAMAEPGSGINS